MSNEDTSLDVENEAYIGVSPEYQNHADVRDEPMRSEHPVVKELEQRGLDWTRAMVVKRVDVSAARPVGIITDVEGNILDTSQPVTVDFQPAENVDGDPLLSSNQRSASGPPDFAKFVADQKAARTGVTPEASAGASTAPTGNPEGDAPPPPEDEYEMFTVPELQDELRRRELATSGNKAELIERLRAADDE